jgi:hypothetical protein
VQAEARTCRRAAASQPFRQREPVLTSRSVAQQIVTQGFYGFQWLRSSCRARTWRFHKLDRPLPHPTTAGAVHVPLRHKQATSMDKASQVLAQGPPSGVPRFIPGYRISQRSAPLRPPPPYPPPSVDRREGRETALPYPFRREGSSEFHPTEGRAQHSHENQVHSSEAKRWLAA